MFAIREFWERARRSTVARGSSWTVLGYGGSQALRLAGNLVLWRLMTPEAFGLMALISTLMQGLAMFSDVGIGPSIIQNERGADPDYLNTAWTIQWLRGAALFLIALVGSVPVAAYFDEPRLVPLVSAVALGSFISGFNSTRLFTLAREVDLGRITLLELSAQAVGLLATVILAALFHSVWAMVLGGLLSGVFKLMLSFFMLPGLVNRPRWDPVAARSLLRFGRWIFFSTLLTFCVMQSDRLIFGKMASMTMLGIYSIAVTLAQLPSTLLDRVFGVVLFPFLSRAHQAGQDFSAVFVRAKRPWLILGGWMTALFVAAGPFIVRILYDARAADAEWMIQIVAASGWFVLLDSANGNALLARGQAQWKAAGSFAKLVAICVLVPVGYQLGGFVGAVVGFASTELARYMVSAWAAHRYGFKSFLGDQLATLATLCAGGMAALVRPGAEQAGHALFTGKIAANLVAAGVMFVVVSAVWGLAMLVPGKHLSLHSFRST